jgi:two-component system sensor histidine kinase UhpB
MRGLLPQLVLRVVAAQILTVAFGAGWVLWATADAAREDARVTAERVAEAIAARPDFMGLAFGGVAPVPAFRDWQDFPRWTLIAPGVCVEFGAEGAPDHRRCGSYLASVTAPPAWFRGLAGAVGLVPDPISRPVRTPRQLQHLSHRHRRTGCRDRPRLGPDRLPDAAGARYGGRAARC